MDGCSSDESGTRAVDEADVDGAVCNSDENGTRAVDEAGEEPFKMSDRFSCCIWDVRL